MGGGNEEGQSFFVLRGVHIPEDGIGVDVDEEIALFLVTDAEVGGHELEGCDVLISVADEVKHFEAVCQVHTGFVIGGLSFSLGGLEVDCLLVFQLL